MVTHCRTPIDSEPGMVEPIFGDPSKLHSKRNQSIAVCGSSRAASKFKQIPCGSQKNGCRNSNTSAFVHRLRLEAARRSQFCNTAKTQRRTQGYYRRILDDCRQTFFFSGSNSFQLQIPPEEWISITERSARILAENSSWQIQILARISSNFHYRYRRWARNNQFCKKFVYNGNFDYDKDIHVLFTPPQKGDAKGDRQKSDQKCHKKWQNGYQEVTETEKCDLSPFLWTYQTFWELVRMHPPAHSR